jgi:tetratricopeptide (TPR) repeat protein
MVGKGSILISVLVFWCIVPVAALPQVGNDDEAARYADAGRRAMAAGQYAAARSNFEQLAKLEPATAEVHATLAAIYFEQHEYELAVREVRTAQKLKPSLPKLDSLLGLSLAELGRFTEALPRLENGFKQSADPDIRRMCGLELLRAYTGLSRDADAVETALALNRLYPDDPEILYHTGRIYGNFAYLMMMKLHDQAAGSIWMLQAQGEANESQKDYGAAIIAFNHVLKIDPQRPGIHYRLGRVYLARFRDTHKSEDRDAAINEYEAELAIDPGNGNAAYEIANQQEALGNLDAAGKGYQQVLGHYPDFEEALVGLAGVDLQSQRPADAVPLLSRATKIRPNDEVAWYRLALAERATGDKEGELKAMDAFKQLHSSTPPTLRRSYSSDEITPQSLDMNAKP